MKRLSTVLLAIMLMLIACSANALELNIDSQSQNTLYELYAQVESQRQLNDLPNQSSYGSVSNYGDFERNPTKHKNEKVRFTGTVIQVSEGYNGNVVYRIAKDGNTNQVFYIQYVRPDGITRILEDDEVVVYATFSELKTYTSTTKKSVTVPYCIADLIIRPVKKTTIKNASSSELDKAKTDIETRLSKLNKPDTNGYVKVSSSNYTDYARRESRHKNEKITFTGKVVQVTEGSMYTVMRIAVAGNSDNIIYTTYTPEENDIHMLENDQVTVQATYSGLHTYSSTLGGEITIPSCRASKVSVNGYKAPTSFSKDNNGYYYVNATTFTDYSRRPGVHRNEKIRFTGKVLQVVEGSNSSQYRIAIGGNSDHVIYVTLPTTKKNVRVLEDDQVTVFATFTELLTYESTMGVAITIPSCDAEKIEVQGYTNTSTQKNTQGQYTVTAKNYDSFARNESTYLYETITFKAKVVQLIEGDDYTQYRMAIDGNSNCMFLTQISDDDMTIRLLEDDEITATGTYYGLYSYKSTLGGKITIPSCIISTYTLKGYTEAPKTTADADGYYTITAANYQEYARNANAHLFEKIRFNGKVVQVVERSSRENVYRIAVDSDSNCMFYIEYTLPKGASRILEDDTVLVSGTYYGMFSYSTTLGSKVTVPAAIAEKISESYKTLKQGSSGNDVVKMKKRMQELGYFSAGATLSNQYNATTTERVKLFQKANGLKQTGIADATTLMLLYSDNAKKNPY